MPTSDLHLFYLTPGAGVTSGIGVAEMDISTETDAVTERTLQIPHSSWVNAPKDVWRAVSDKIGEDEMKHVSSERLNTATALVSRLFFGEDPDILAEQYTEFADMIPDMLASDLDLLETAYIAGRAAQKNRGSSKEAAQEFAKKVAKLSSSKKTKAPPGNKGGPASKTLWTGPGSGTFFKNIPETEVLEALGSVNFIEEGVRYSSDWIQGKPKESVEYRAARSINDLKFCTTSQLTIPEDIFWLKYVKGELFVQVPMTQIKHKRQLIVLLDDSGSMCNSAKVNWIQAIFEKILEEILKGDTIMYFTPFEWDRNPFIKIESPQEVNDLRMDFRYGSGGGTHLERILPPLIEDIQNGEVDGFKVNPRTEIIIINDGQDEIPSLKSPVPISAVVLFEDNLELRKLTATSGGKYFLVNAHGIKSCWC